MAFLAELIWSALISTVTEESFFTFLASLYLHFALVDTTNNSAQSIAKIYGFKQGHRRIKGCPTPRSPAVTAVTQLLLCITGMLSGWFWSATRKRSRPLPLSVVHILDKHSSVRNSCCRRFRTRPWRREYGLQTPKETDHETKGLSSWLFRHSFVVMLAFLATIFLANANLSFAASGKKSPTQCRNSAVEYTESPD